MLGLEDKSLMADYSQGYNDGKILAKMKGDIRKTIVDVIVCRAGNEEYIIKCLSINLNNGNVIMDTEPPLTEVRFNLADLQAMKNIVTYCHSNRLTIGVYSDYSFSMCDEAKLKLSEFSNCKLDSSDEEILQDLEAFKEFCIDKHPESSGIIEAWTAATDFSCSNNAVCEVPTDVFYNKTGSRIIDVSKAIGFNRRNIDRALCIFFSIRPEMPTKEESSKLDAGSMNDYKTKDYKYGAIAVYITTLIAKRNTMQLFSDYLFKASGMTSSNVIISNITTSMLKKIELCYSSCESEEEVLTKICNYLK